MAIVDRMSIGISIEVHVTIFSEYISCGRKWRDESVGTKMREQIRCDVCRVFFCVAIDCGGAYWDCGCVYTRFWGN